MQKRYFLVKEPRRKAYHKLLNCSLEYCDAFLLVVRRTLPLHSSARELLRELQPFLLCESEESKWPGTQLSGDTAKVYRFRLCAETISILSEFSDGLFSWRQPALPEDLCLLRKGQSPWLITVAHEKDAYLELTVEEKTSLLTKIPELSINE